MHAVCSLFFQGITAKHIQFIDVKNKFLEDLLEESENKLVGVWVWASFTIGVLIEKNKRPYDRVSIGR
eukprot:c42482_g1_i1 orf=2-205(+)